MMLEGKRLLTFVAGGGEMMIRGGGPGMVWDDMT
jgi:hypothetical protein